MRNRQLVQASIDREKMGAEAYDKLHQMDESGGGEEIEGLKRDLKLYPQGGDKQVMLRDKF